MVARDHDYQNVVVTVRESHKTEYVVAIADSDGEFVVSEPVYRDTRRVHFVEGAQSTAELCATRQKLEEADYLLELASARERELLQQIAELQDTLQECEEQGTETCDDLRQQLVTEKEKAKSSWRKNCEYLTQQDTVISVQDEKIATLRQRITELESLLSSHRDVRASPSRVAPAWPSCRPGNTEPVTTRVTPSAYPHPERVSPPSSTVAPLPEHDSSRELNSPEGASSDVTSDSAAQRQVDSLTQPESAAPTGSTYSNHPSTGPNTQQRRGRAPPIEFFSGEDPAITVDDWLPSLERASSWNGWSTSEKLMQLPGYLKGRALQEWRLLSQSEQNDFTAAVNALRARLDPGSKTMAAQDFRHSLQRSGEGVPDFIRRLEKTFQIAYGKDDLNHTTRDTLLYGQLYEGLSYDLMQSPAVSGAQSYQELCTAAKGEEKRLAALKQ